jgi:hemerythrin-like metal-binding protein
VCNRLPIRWLPEYAVGIQEIDQEHRGLFARAEKLHLAIRAGQGSESLLQTLDELVDYTCYHFAHEEELMQRISYPHYLDHCSQHEALRSEVRAMRERVASGDAGLATDVMQLMVDWLKCHTTTSDRRIGTYTRKCCNTDFSP